MTQRALPHTETTAATAMPPDGAARPYVVYHRPDPSRVEGQARFADPCAALYYVACLHERVRFDAGGYLRLRKEQGAPGEQAVLLAEADALGLHLVFPPPHEARDRGLAMRWGSRDLPAAAAPPARVRPRRSGRNARPLRHGH